MQTHSTVPWQVTASHWRSMSVPSAFDKYNVFLLSNLSSQWDRIQSDDFACASGASLTDDTLEVTWTWAWAHCFHSLVLCGKFSASFIFVQTCQREILLLSFQLVRTDQELFLHGSCRMSCNIEYILKCFPKGSALCKNELLTTLYWTQIHSLQKLQDTNTWYSHFSKSNVPGGNFSHMLAILYFARAGPGQTQCMSLYSVMPCVVCFHTDQTLLRCRKIVI